MKSLEDADNAEEVSERTRRKIGIAVKDDALRKLGGNETEEVSGSLGLVFLK